MRLILAAFAAILLALMLSAAADADPPAVLIQAQQQQCGPLDKIQEVLKSEYGESPAAAMEREQGPLLIFSNRETGTFTIIAMRTADAGCIIASGDGFQVFWQRPAPPPTRGAGS